MNMREATKKEGHAKDETDAEADEIEGVHGHRVCRLVRLFVLTGLGSVVEVNLGECAVAVSGRRTSSRRSAREGVLSTSSRSSRQRRESLFCASVRSAWQSSGSRRNRSAPLTSQRS